MIKIQQMFSFKLREHFFLCWGLILISTFLVQILTISFLPGISLDEVQITDYGRLSMYPNSDWSMTWLIRDEKPLLLWSYIGPLFAEIGFNVGGHSGIGARIVSLIGGLGASTMALGWLLERQIPKYIAGCLSLAFLLDPLFTLSQRMARSDSWVMLFCLASCWLLRSSRQKKNKLVFSRILLAGALAATAALVWPSAIFLYPLILLEFYELLKSEPSGQKRLLHSLGFLSAGLIITVLLFIPIRESLFILYNDISKMVTLNVDSSKSSLEKSLAIFDINNWFKLIKTFVKTFSPCLPMLAVISLFYLRQTGLKLMLLLTLLTIFSSLIYEFRLLYLLPYFLALGGGIFVKGLKPQNRTLYRVSKITLGVTLAWSIVISIFIRSGLALNDKALYDRKGISYAAESTIGKGNYKVFLAFTYEFYFAGRALGWEVYTPYIEYSYDSLGNWKRENDFQPKDKFLKLLSKMDYAVFAKGSVTKDLSKQLIESGLQYRKTIFLNKKVNDTYWNAESRESKILQMFLFGYRSYGPYQIFERKNMKANLVPISLN